MWLLFLQESRKSTRVDSVSSWRAWNRQDFTTSMELKKASLLWNSWTRSTWPLAPLESPTTGSGGTEPSIRWCFPVLIGRFITLISGILVSLMWWSCFPPDFNKKLPAAADDLNSDWLLAPRCCSASSSLNLLTSAPNAGVVLPRQHQPCCDACFCYCWWWLSRVTTQINGRLKATTGVCLLLCLADNRVSEEVRLILMRPDITTWLRRAVWRQHVRWQRETPAE